MRKVLLRTGAAAAGITALVALTGSPASAHVSVSSTDATQGGYSKVTFRVPNEKDAGVTTAVEVDLPKDTPIASVSVKPTPGWTATITKSKLDKPLKDDDGAEITEAVSQIIWKADTADTGIQVGQFQEFDVSAGPLPEADAVVFKALQTYSDGDIVRWIEEPGSDGKEPEHPAPTLKLAKASSDTSNASETTTASGVDSDARSRASLGLGVGIAALVIALIGVALAMMSARRRPTA